MTEVSTVELPKLPEETPKAYAARVEYVTMGTGRSLEKLRQKYNRNTSYIRQLGAWSSRYGWQESARQYDEQIAYLIVQEAADEYRANLAAHRKRAMDASKNLHILAGQLAQAMNSALASPRTIEGKDGKFYKLHGIEINTNTLAIVSKALTTALDLEAHALGIDALMPTLTNNDEPPG